MAQHNLSNNIYNRNIDSTLFFCLGYFVSLNKKQKQNFYYNNENII